mmetsp:Transcript_14899/g.46186  ORF Transcript_14899/g.46186 Transcript_14899/m.46186 type:complete len:279 (-) Transcript_14899:693-1529(-)
MESLLPEFRRICDSGLSACSSVAAGCAFDGSSVAALVFTGVVDGESSDFGCAAAGAAASVGWAMFGWVFGGVVPAAAAASGGGEEVGVRALASILATLSLTSCAAWRSSAAFSSTSCSMRSRRDGGICARSFGTTVGSSVAGCFAAAGFAERCSSSCFSASAFDCGFAGGVVAAGAAGFAACAGVVVFAAGASTFVGFPCVSGATSVQSESCGACAAGLAAGVVGELGGVGPRSGIGRSSITGRIMSSKSFVFTTSLTISLMSIPRMALAMNLASGGR